MENKTDLPEGFFINYYYSNNERVGTFFYDNEIHDLNSENGIKSYKFIFLLEEARKFGSRKTDGFCERIEFIATCNLQDYKSEFERLDLEKWKEGIKPARKKEIDFDPEKLMLAFIPDQYAYHIERLKRKIAGKIPKSISCDEEYYKGMEFLVFTDETAHHWAGPLEQDGKLGAAMKFNHTLDIVPPILNARTKWSYYDVPSSVRQDLDLLAKNLNDPEIPRGDHLINTWSEEQKGQYFDSLTESQKYLISKKYYSTQTTFIIKDSPYYVYLCGNDDCSYIKYCCSEEMVLAEMDYLRMMQPLDFNLDIVKRGYEFTN